MFHFSAKFLAILSDAIARFGMIAAALATIFAACAVCVVLHVMVDSRLVDDEVDI